MTKNELKKAFLEGKVMDELFHFCQGDDCLIYKADEFTLGDEIIYIPDVGMNFRRYLDSPVPPGNIEDILSMCYTGKDFLDVCNGDAKVAERLFWFCDWQHPSAAYECWGWDDDEDGVEMLIANPLDLARQMVDDLGNGNSGCNDGCSSYFALAKGKGDKESDLVSACLVECITPEDSWYAIHFINDVKGSYCSILNTNHLNFHELVGLLAEILDKVEKGEM